MTDFSTRWEPLREGLGLVELGGEIDLYTAPRFKDDLVARHRRRRPRRDRRPHRGDLHRLDGARSPHQRRQAPARGRRAAVHRRRDAPRRRILAITGLDKVLSIFSTRDDACAAL